MIHMIVLHIKPQEVTILSYKKSVIGGNSSYWSTKELIQPIVKNGSITSVDTLTSIIKEITSGLENNSEKEISILLDHSFYELSRFEIPAETLQNEYHSYLKSAFQKAQNTSEDTRVFEMVVREFESSRFGFVYSFDKITLSAIEESLRLIDLKASAIVPEHLALYALFEKTLRLDKHENILFVNFESNFAEGYLFDTFGPISSMKPWRKEKVSLDNIESIIKDKSEEWSKKMPKLNRVIIAGSLSDKIRQDTFTKNVGVWTNPLKRIIPHFYQEYLNLLKPKIETSPTFPVLQLASIFGGFVTVIDGKAFPFQKIGIIQKNKIFQAPITKLTNPSMDNTPGFKIPKEIILFAVIFVITFSLFYFIASSKSESGISLPIFNKPTETPTPSPTVAPPTPTPTVEVKREEVNIKVLNGTGVAGQAAGVKQVLIDAGYLGVVTANADKYDYAQSVVQIKSDKSFVRDTIVEDIKSLITDPKIEDLDASENADIVIIIGKDIK